MTAILPIMGTEGMRLPGLTRICPTLAAMLVALLVAVVPKPADAARTPAVADVRVLIDVSGSMKHNDPHNLRGPALRLLVGLMPTGSRAGVWTFAQSVNMQVPLAIVDAHWRATARAASHRIGSPGLFTNIESALRRASVGWKTPDAAVRRSLILLTDGMVDVSKDAAENAASRQRILTQLLPRLRAAGVHIHTVALSANADRKLLRALALGTDGWFEQVDDASRLQRIFLRLFEQSVPSESVPLKSNHFTVDNSIKDMTVLVFRKAGAAATRLVDPRGQVYRSDQHPSSVRWHHDHNYDMVTVAAPARGGWRIDAAQDPDNRVLVITNLKLVAGPLPSHILVGERPIISASLLRDGKTITDQTFLQLTRFEVRDNAEADIPPLRLLDDGRAPDVNRGDGLYSARLAAELKSGEHELVLRVRGETFEREVHRAIRVHALPVTVQMASPADRQGAYRLMVTPDPDLVRPDGLQLQSRIGQHDGTPLRARFERDHWSLTVAPEYGGQTVYMRVTGKLVSGAPLSVSLQQPIPKVEAPVETPDETQQKAVAPAAEVPSTVQLPEAESAQPGPAAVDWVHVAIVVAAVNLLLIGLAGGAYFLWQRRSRAPRAPVKQQAEPADD